MRQRMVAALIPLLVLAPPVAGQDLPESSPEAIAEHAQGIRFYLAAEHDQAVEHFYRAYELDPTFYVSLFMAAVTHGNARRRAQEDSLYAIVAEHKHRLSPYYQYRLAAQMAARAGQRDHYVAMNRQAAREAPGTKAAYNLAQGAVPRQRPAEARDALRSLDPEREPMRGWWPYYSIYTNAAHALEDFEDELAMARRARKAFPGDIRAADREAQALAALGRTADLERLFPELDGMALVGNWTPGSVMTTAAQELTAHGHERAGTRVLERALTWFDRLPPEKAAIQPYLGGHAYTLFTAGRYADAAAIAREFPENPFNLAWAGYLAALTGDRQTAQRTADRIESGEIALAPLARSRWLARLSAAAGDADRAAALLSATDTWLRWIHREPVLRARLGEHPVFLEFLRPKG